MKAGSRRKFPRSCRVLSVWNSASSEATVPSYANTESLCCTLDTNIMLSDNCTLILKTQKLNLILKTKKKVAGGKKPIVHQHKSLIKPVL